MEFKLNFYLKQNVFTCETKAKQKSGKVVNHIIDTRTNGCLDNHTW